MAVKRRKQPVPRRQKRPAPRRPRRAAPRRRQQRYLEVVREPYLVYARHAPYLYPYLHPPYQPTQPVARAPRASSSLRRKQYLASRALNAPTHHLQGSVLDDILAQA